VGLSLVFLFGFLVFIAVVIAVIVLAVHVSTRPAYPAGVPPTQMGAAPPARETPLEILARRFASGEITAEEYQRARDLLGGGGKT
jgi:uncharacterized membrane protein